MATKLSPGRLDEALDAIKQTVVSRSSFRGGPARDMSQRHSNFVPLGADSCSGPQIIQGVGVF